jgi:hypothetical protein
MFTLIMPNVSKEGDKLYRVRYTRNGKRISKFFTSRKEAITYRKKVLG